MNIQQRILPPDNSLPTHLHPVIRRILAARQVHSEAELDYGLKNLLPYQQLSQIDTAVDLLERALRQAWRLVIVADFDVDGATSCALAVRALRAMGAAEVEYVVPDRIKHGYGLSPEIVNIAAQFNPQLLITVDNGIASIAGVAAAKQQGIQVLVTDHHLAGDELPDADAIVNPNQRGDAFPSKALAGVGVVFYVMMALRARLRETGWFADNNQAEPNLAKWLDLVALGIVADVVPLDYNNRILVSQGLARMRSGACCAGITALCQISGRKQTDLVASDLGFYLGPRLNAAGRMDDMSYGIDCLLNDDLKSALEQAQTLDLLNQERRAVQDDMQADADILLEKLSLDASTLPFGLCLYDAHWHQGVVGILASKIKEQVHRPVIVFASHPDNPDVAKGSARSVKGIHIRDILAYIDAQNPDLISQFGGHAMAAGLSLDLNKLDIFKQAFDEQVHKHIDISTLEGELLTDGMLEIADFNLDFADTLRTLTPWGQHFPEPLFNGRFQILEKRVLKDKHLKMLVMPEKGNLPVDVIAFFTTDETWDADTQWVNLVYRLDINQFRGLKSLQLLAEHVEPV